MGSNHLWQCSKEAVRGGRVAEISVHSVRTVISRPIKSSNHGTESRGLAYYAARLVNHSTGSIGLTFWLLFLLSRSPHEVGQVLSRVFDKPRPVPRASQFLVLDLDCQANVEHQAVCWQRVLVWSLDEWITLPNALKIFNILNWYEEFRKCEHLQHNDANI